MGSFSYLCKIYCFLIKMSSTRALILCTASDKAAVTSRLIKINTPEFSPGKTFSSMKNDTSCSRNTS